MPNVTSIGDFHASPENYYHYVDNKLALELKNEVINQEDFDIIHEYLIEIGLNINSPARIYKHALVLTTWRKYIGPFTENKASDLFNGIRKLRYGKKVNGDPYADSYIQDCIKFLKRFYKWLVQKNYSSIDKEDIAKLKTKESSQLSVTAEDLISEEQVMQMINACPNTRDRAMVAVLYEAGLRIHELGTLRWQQVEFSSWNVAVRVSGKTGKPRYIPLVTARPYLAAWKADYPFEPKGENHVFISLNQKAYPEHVRYRGYRKRLTIIAKRAGIIPADQTREIRPHLFRHSRITHLIQKGMSESVIKKLCWGDVGTNMLKVYLHLTGDDVDREIARMEGIITDEKQKESPFEARQCSRCHSVNTPTARFCSICGLELCEEAVAEVDEVRAALLFLLEHGGLSKLSELEKIQ